MRGSFAVELTIYAVYIIGILICSRKTIAVFAKSLKLRHRLARKNFDIPALDPRIARLLPLCLLLFFASLLLAWHSFSAAAAIAVSVMAASLPLLVSMLKAGSQKKKAGKEGLSLVTELFRQYRIRDRNIYSAIEAAIASEGDFPVCRRYLSQLLLRLRDAGSKAEVRAACRSFSSSTRSFRHPRSLPKRGGASTARLSA